MRTPQRQTRLLVMVSMSLVSTAGVTRSDTPTTAPADSPEVKEVRDVIVNWNKVCPTWSLADVRKVYHTENEREAVYADYSIHEGWEDIKTQKVVRDKWGPEGEAKFAHFLGCDTVEDDQAAEITVDGTRATVKWKTQDIQTLPLIKIDGHWLIDMHTSFEASQKENPDFDKHQTVQSGKLLQQASADIKDGKFDDADSFLADFKKKYDALTGTN